MSVHQEILWLIMPFLVCSTTTADYHIPNIGVSVELTGQVLRVQEIINIPAVLSLGHFNNIFQNSSEDEVCPATISHMKQAIVEEILTSVRYNIAGLLSATDTDALHAALCEHEQEVCKLVTTRTKSSRQKRFLFTAGASVGVGLGALGYWLYDKLAGNSAYEETQKLRAITDVIKGAVQHNSHDIWRTHQELSHLVALSITSANDIRMTKIALKCAESRSDVLLRALPLVSMLPNQFHRSINSILQGRVTPDLISYRKLRSIINQTESLKDSLYALDPTLFYQFAHAVPVEADAKTAFISFLVQVPKLMKESLGLVYTIYNFGRHTGSVTSRIKLPTHITRFKNIDGSFDMSSVDGSKCQVASGLWLCSQQAWDHSYNTQCLNNVLVNSTSGCLWEVQQNTVDPDILITSNLVFHHSSNYTTTLFNLTAGRRSSKVIDPSVNQTHVFQLSSFDTLIVAQYHIDGTRSPNPTLINSMNITDLTLPTIPNASDIPLHWVDYSSIMSEDHRISQSILSHVDELSEISHLTLWKNLSIGSIFTSFFVFGIGTLFGMFLYAKYQAHKRTKMIQSNYMAMCQMEQEKSRLNPTV